MAPAKNKIVVKFDYDKEADVLYAHIGKPRPAYSEETIDGVLIRRDPKTDRIVGFTIINYSRKKARGQLDRIPHFPAITLP
ncbi:MAG: DUF2283 domain-containing protein [candidate division Zixibacteria bacterium]|nr:DUF2283 domain-containing protein [candidate division Zixibacteria bacterium]